jgi:protein-tyrosine phosphatase
MQVDDFIFRGPKIDFGFLDIKNLSSTLDLESGKQVIGDDMPLEEAVSGDEHGIRVYPHPLGVFFPPTLTELRLAVQFMMNQKKSQRTLYVHCRHGVDRTGIVCAAYRVIAQGATPFQAAVECVDKGMHLVYYPWLIQLFRL